MAKAKEKSKKSTRQQKNAISRYFSETIGELRKVTWPTRREAINLTWIVLAVMIGMSLVLGSLDWVFTKIFSLIMG